MKKNIKKRQVLIVNSLILVLIPLLLSVWIILSDDWLNFGNFFTIFRKSCLGIMGHLLFHGSLSNSSLFVDIVVIFISIMAKIGLLNFILNTINNSSQKLITITIGVSLYSIISGVMGIIYAIAI